MSLVECEKRPDGIWIVTFSFLSDQPSYVTEAILDNTDSILQRFCEDMSAKGLMIVWQANQTYKDIDPSFITRLITDTDGDRPDRRADAVILPFHKLGQTFYHLGMCRKPITCVIEGVCSGIGFELSLASHYRIITSNSIIGLYDNNPVSPPFLGGVTRLSRLIGLEKAMPVFLGDCLLTSEQACHQGLSDAIAPTLKNAIEQGLEWLDTSIQNDKKSNRLCHPDPVFDTGEGSIENKCFGYTPQSLSETLSSPTTISFLAETNALLAQNHQSCHPVYRSIVQTLYDTLPLDTEYALETEKAFLSSFLMNPFTVGMVRTSKISPAALQKSPHKPKDVPSTSLKKIAIIGAGHRGLFLAKQSFKAGLDVVILEKDAEKAQETAENLYLEMNLSHKERKNLNVTSDIQAISGSHFILECLPANLQLKQQVLSILEPLVGSKCLIALTTSHFTVSDIADSLERSKNVLGLCFTNISQSNALVEIIEGKKTSDRAIAAGFDCVQLLEMTPILVKDCPLFYIQSGKMAYLTEISRLMHEGVSAVTLERMAFKIGMRESPFETMSEKEIRDLYRPQIIAENNPLSSHDIKDRMRAIQILHAIHYLENDLVQDVRELDIGSVWGWGFPQHTGGVLSYLDAVGMKSFFKQCERLSKLYGDRFRPSPLMREMGRMGNMFYKRFIPHLLNLKIKPVLIETCSVELEKVALEFAQA